MFEEVDTRFEFVIPAYENGRYPSKSGGVGSNEIFRISSQVLLLTAAQTQLTNLLQKWPQSSLTDDEIGGSFAAIPQRAGASPVAVKMIGCRLIDTK